MVSHVDFCLGVKNRKLFPVTPFVFKTWEIFALDRVNYMTLKKRKIDLF